MANKQVPDSVLQNEKKKADVQTARVLKGEKRVKVYGNEMYQQFLGKQYTFLFNGNPVTIKFNGTYQEYPETVANLLQDKLSKTAVVNTAKTTNVRI